MSVALWLVAEFEFTEVCVAPSPGVGFGFFRCEEQPPCLV